MYVDIALPAHNMQLKPSKNMERLEEQYWLFAVLLDADLPWVGLTLLNSFH